MSNKVKILIVEDELIIAEDMRELLEEMGYEVPYIAMNLKEGIEALEKYSPDVAMVDIMLGGRPSGLELARYIRSQYDMPFVFCTSHADRSTVEAAKASKPNGYLMKPFSADELYTSIEIALVNYSGAKSTGTNGRGLYEEKQTETGELLVKDGMFVKQGQMFVKVKFEQMLWLEPDGNYTTIVTNTAKYIVRSTLKDIIDKLPSHTFYRAHRSYVINLAHVEAIDLHQAKIADKNIPLGKAYRDELIRRINLMQ